MVTWDIPSQAEFGQPRQREPPDWHHLPNQPNPGPKKACFWNHSAFGTGMPGLRAHVQSVDTPPASDLGAFECRPRQAPPVWGWPHLKNMPSLGGSGPFCAVRLG